LASGIKFSASADGPENEGSSKLCDLAALAMTAAPATMRRPHRIHFLDESLSAVEIHSVPIGMSVHSYAKSIIDRARFRRPTSQNMVETGDRNELLGLGRTLFLLGSHKKPRDRVDRSRKSKSASSRNDHPDQLAF
jgi:hypothetical protein